MDNEGTQEEMQAVFGEVLELCGVNTEQKVAVLSEGDILQERSEAFLHSIPGRFFGEHRCDDRGVESIPDPVEDFNH